jgi:hypothetical protein
MKLKLFCISLIIMVFTFPSICFSKQPDPKVWEFYGNDSKGGSYYCSKNSMSKSPGIISLRIYYSVTEKERAERVEKIKKFDLKKSAEYENYDHDISEVEIDCKNKLVLQKEFAEYDLQGKALKYDINNNNEWQMIPPQTVIDEFYKKNCVTGKKKTKKK